MAAQQKIKTGNGCLVINFWRVRKQDRKCLAWNAQCGRFDIMGVKIMGIVNTGQIDGRPATLNWFTLIDQHANPHHYKIRDHADGVVIAEHAADRPQSARQN